MDETDLPRILEITARLEFRRTEREYRLTGSRQAGSKRLVWVTGDKSCPFCRYMEGKAVRSDDPRIDLLIPAHIGCECLWAEVGDREVGKLDWLDFEDPEFVELRDTHAHFAKEPSKYEALRVPASPSGRDFVFRRGKAGEPGTREWKRPRYEERDDLIETGVEERGERWRPLDRAPRAQSDRGVDDDLGDDPEGRFIVPPIDRDLPGHIAALSDIPAAEAWARTRFPTVTFDFAEMHIDAIRPALAQFERLAEEWPSVLKRVEYIGTGRGPEGRQFSFDDDEYASSGDGTIRLNPSFFGDPAYLLERKVRRAEDAWFHSGAGSISETITHEWGHELHARLLEDEDSAPQVRKFEAENRKHKGWTDNADEDWTGAEAFAEAFSLRYHPGTEVPNPYVTAFNQLLDLLTEGKR